MLAVVAAFICREDEILLCQRPAGKPRAGLWEFPGGKVEQGEDPRAALKREIMEELGARVSAGERLARVQFDYPDVSVELSLYRASLLPGECPRPREGQTLRWVLKDDAAQLELCPADRELWRMITKQGGRF